MRDRINEPKKLPVRDSAAPELEDQIKDANGPSREGAAPGAADPVQPAAEAGPGPRLSEGPVVRQTEWD